MDRPRHDIDPLVPELSTVAPEDTEQVVVERREADDHEVEGPFVPHVSY